MKYLYQRNPNYINDIWGDFQAFFDAPSSPFPSISKELLSQSNSYQPATDLYEDDNNYILRVELPGFSKDEIVLELKKRQLVLEARRQEGGEGQERELSHSRTIRIPADVKSSEITAKHEHGILTVMIPKAESAKPVQITINS